MSMSSLGIWKIAVDTANLADGHSIAAYLTSSSGALLDSVAIGGNESLYITSASEHAEDSAHVSGDRGNLALVVRNDTPGSLVSADGDYAPLQVDADGRLRVLADLTAAFDYTYAEDSAHGDGDVGAFVLAVRQDTLSSSTSADGDYGALKQNSVGELYVKDLSANAALTSINSDTTTIGVNTGMIATNTSNIATSAANIDTSTAAILAELLSLTQAEDAAHTSGDLGIMSLAVRNDTPGSLASADGDYAPLQVDANGNLRISGSVTISGSFAEDSAHTNADNGLHVLTVRKDALSSNVSADGDYGSFLAWSEGSVKVVDMPNISILTTAVSVDNTVGGIALPASSLAQRRIISVQNRGDKSIFVGPSGVTTASGVEIPKGASFEFNAGPSVAFYGITASGTADVRVMELS